MAFAVCAGLLAALGELVVLACRRWAFDQQLHLSSNVAWMAPLNDGLVFTALGLVLALLAALLGSARAARLGVLLVACVGGLVTYYLLPNSTRLVQLASVIAAVVCGYFAIGVVLRRAGTRRAVLFVCIFCASFAVVFGIPRLYPSAQYLLAFGLAWRITGLISGSPQLERRTRRTLGALTAMFCVTGVGLAVWHVVSERRAVASLPAADAGARNVLLIIWDTVRSSSLGIYGNTLPTTPVLARLAERGTTFDWAFATAPWTLPSHASMFTGRFPHDLSADLKSPLDAQYPTLAERLTSAGFVTAGFASNGFYANKENGLARGFLHYEDYVVSPGEIFVATAFGRALIKDNRLRRIVGYYEMVGGRSADDISSSFLSWLDRRPNRPFFAFLNYFDAHEPYLPPEPWRSRFGSQTVRKLWLLNQDRVRVTTIPARASSTPAEHAAETAAYEGAIAYLDNRLGLLIDSLGRRGLLDNTVIIVASDHGEHEGEHPGTFGHAATLYTQETRVPLIIIEPKAPGQGRRVTEPVSLRDLAATVLDVAHASTATPLPGRSLSRFWRQDSVGASPPDTVLSELSGADVSAIVTGRYHFVRTRYGGGMLFDLNTDPEELRDLANSPPGNAIAASIKTSYRPALTALTRLKHDTTLVAKED
jgi:arylsulfatase A-like enzyme